MPKRWSIQMTLVDDDGGARRSATTARASGGGSFKKEKVMDDRDARRAFDAVKVLATRLLKDD
jgi:hypothetical protein